MSLCSSQCDEDEFGSSYDAFQVDLSTASSNFIKIDQTFEFLSEFEAVFRNFKIQRFSFLPNWIAKKLSPKTLFLSIDFFF